MANQDFEDLTHEFEEIAHIWNEYDIYALKLGEKGFYKIVASNNRNLVDTYFEAYHPLDTVIDTGSGVFVRYLYSEDASSYIPHLFVAQVIDSKETGKPIGVLMLSSNIESLLTSLWHRASKCVVHSLLF